MLKKLIEFIFSFFKKSDQQAEDFKEKASVESNPINLVAENHCEILICSKCGQEYYSSGKHDPGICKNCFAIENFIGGPLGK